MLEKNMKKKEIFGAKVNERFECDDIKTRF